MIVHTNETILPEFMQLTTTTFLNSVPELPGYAIVNQLYAGSRTIVYQAVEESSQRRVTIKLLRQDYPSFNDLLQFRNQYTIAKNLNFPGIGCSYRLENYRNGYALVMEDFGGIALRQYIQEQALAVPEVLAIALQLAEILHYLYQNRVVHKDINPANILIHPESKQVKLIDFSISSLLPRETQEIQNPNLLEGTLAYLSPEQTGRMNRGIDYRADFYALGVTIYELLTGQVPFQSDDPMELVHCHLTKYPISPHIINPAIPMIVSEIVLKLMAKNAESRYQSALGLKHDLEQCLEQWNSTGKIKDFALGQRDVSDRFLIPEKLYGREVEVKQLLDAFDRVSQGHTELMLVAGFSGIGKTAVINEVHKPIVRQRGYFIKGKYDQFQRNIPFSAFVQAFRGLMAQLLSESQTQLATWKEKILAAVGENGQVIIDVIPELEAIVGPQPLVPELTGHAAQNRFNLLFQKFIQVFTIADHPLVIFLDDLQWADAASLNLLNVLMTEARTGYLLILGAYRDNEVFPAHPLMLILDQIEKAQASVHTISLRPLTEKTTNQLVADTLSCTFKLAESLTQLVYQKTKGNPFFATQFLKALHEGGWIDYHPELACWQCDMAAVQQLVLTDDVVEFMALQLQKLPLKTQEILKLAACIGNQFDLNTLAIVSEKSPIDVASLLWKVLQEGLILPVSERYKFYQSTDSDTLSFSDQILVPYKFLHDRIQQAAYSLICSEQKQLVHLQIGRCLVRHIPVEHQESRIFEIVSQLNQAINFITNVTEREDLVRFNLLAAHKARMATAYVAALDYAKTSLQLLTSDCWSKQYNLTLSIYLEAAESAYLSGEFNDSIAFIQQILEHTTVVLDRIKAYETLILVKIAQDCQQEAIEIGMDVLAQLHIPLVSVSLDDQNTIAQLPRLDAVPDVPNMVDPASRAAMRVLSTIAPPVHHVKPELFPAVALTMLHLCLERGHCADSAYAYGIYSLLCWAVTGDFELAYRACQVGLKLLEQFSAKDISCKVHMLFGVFISACKDPGAVALRSLQQAIQLGQEVGDIEHIGYSMMAEASFMLILGTQLETVLERQKQYLDWLKVTKQKHALDYSRIWNYLASSLQIAISDKSHLISIEKSDADLLAHFQMTHNHQSLFAYHLAHTISSYLFGQVELATTHALEAVQYKDGAFGLFLIASHKFYYLLSLLAQYSNQTQERQAQILKTVDQEHQTLYDWAFAAPCNFQHQYDLILAERSRIAGDFVQAIEAYDRAIAAAKVNGYIHEEAIANELAAKFYLSWNKEKVAAGYMQEAYYCYAHWGSAAKTSDLEACYSNLLSPILQQSPQPLTVLETLITVGNSNRSIHSAPNSLHSSSTSVNTVLDFALLLKASQSLFGTIHLNELLHQLTQIILQHSGGDRCALIRPDYNGEWRVEAIATSDETKLCSDLLDNSINLPVKLIHYVKNTETFVVINHLKTDLPVIDDYLIREQPQSILGLPVFNQAQLIGVLFLENRSTRGVFTSDRLLVLNFLCTQAAISLENARLYQQSQSYAQQLEQSQLQIIQSEKMASLGNLVAGVAHEINNPIGFLNGSINNVEDYVEDLLDYLALYQQYHPNPAVPVQDKAEDIDLEFLKDDLPKLLDSMRGAMDRIKSISTSLRIFSRADTEYKVSANPHEGIDSALLILKYRLKANEHRPGIQIIREYGELPPIKCFPGQLNQVFMNILANAIDVFDEMAQTQSFQHLEANPQEIKIHTAMVGERLEIRIRDNGKGMSEDVKARIFDHLFTTKGVGRGTGLGLAIARQIIVEKHHGDLEVQSEMGQGTEFYIRLPIE